MPAVASAPRQNSCVSRPASDMRANGEETVAEALRNVDVSDAADAAAFALAPTARVVVVGLSKREELNGCEARVLFQHEARWASP